jgi:hypothetical protein
VTNEAYLPVSYFAAAAGGVALAAATAAVLARPGREATAEHAPGPLARIVRRVLPTWLILAALMGFASVTYFDCGHDSYSKIVADRDHLVHKTGEQASAISNYLAVALAAYGLVLVFFLWARAAARRTARLTTFRKVL